MDTVLVAAGRAFLLAFGASILVLAPGIADAPNLNRAYALGVAALMASIAAGLRAVQVFVPKLSFQKLISEPYGLWLDTFVQAAIGAFIATLIPVLNSPDLNTVKAGVTAALVGAISAGFAALNGLLTPNQRPMPQVGLKVPPA